MAQRESKDVIKNRDNSNISYCKHQQKNANKLLSMKLKDANGKLSSVFKVVEANCLQRYCCRLCSKNNMDVLKLIMHAESKKHKLKLRMADVKFSSSKLRIDSTVQVLSELQTRLNEITDQVMIGVEYIIEVSYGDTFEQIFHCVLCEGKFDSQVVIHHLTSYVHRLNYLEKHFPTAFKKISAMEKREQKYNFLEMICQNIEHRYGRMSMKTVQSDQFATSQSILYDSILNAKHFDEKMGRTFTESEDVHQKNGLSPVSEFEEAHSTCGLEPVSTSSEFEMSPYEVKGKRRNQKLNLSPVTPERRLEFDRKFRTTRDEDSFRTLPHYADKRHVIEKNDRSPTKKKRTSVKSSSEYYVQKEIDEKYSIKIGIKSPKRKCTRKKGHKSHTIKRDRSRSPLRRREKDHQPHEGRSHTRNRSRSPQDYQFLTRSHRQSPVDYGKIRAYDNFELHRSGRSGSPLLRLSHDYLLSYNGRYNHPTGAMTVDDFRQDYRPIPASIEWKINNEELALGRSSLRANRTDCPSIYSGYDYKHPTIRRDGAYTSSRPHLDRTSRADYSLNRPTSIDYGEYVPYRKRPNYLLSCNGGPNQPTETVVSNRAYKDDKPIRTSIKPDMGDGEPITIISVLSLLSAFENFLGSLGPKMIELMAEAIAMENIGVNFSNRILDDLTHCILFETTKEKLKGLLSAGIVEENKIMGVKRAVRQMELLIDEANERKRIGATSSQNSNNRIDTTVTSTSSQIESHDRYAVAEKILVAMNEQGKADISKVKLAQYVDQYMTLVNAKDCDDEREEMCAIDKAVGEFDPDCDNVNTETRHIYEPTLSASDANGNLSSVLVGPIGTTTQPNLWCRKDSADANSSAFQAIPSTTLSDSNLTTLMKNFLILSDMEKEELIMNIREIKRYDPERMQRLRSKMEVEEFLNFKFGSSELPDEKTVTVKTLKSESV